MKKKLLYLTVSTLMVTFLTTGLALDSKLEEKTSSEIKISDIQARLSTIENALNATSAQLEDVASILKNDPRIEKLQNELKALKHEVQIDKQQRANELQQSKTIQEGKNTDLYSILSSSAASISMQELVKYLGAIKLPDTPTNDNIKKYIADIYRLKIVQNHAQKEANTLIQSKLIELGHDIFPELLPYLDYSNVAVAAQKLVTHADKELIISKLPFNSPDSQYHDNSPNNQYHYNIAAMINLYIQVADESDKKNIIRFVTNNPSALRLISTFKLSEEDARELSQGILRSENFNKDGLISIIETLRDLLTEKDFDDFCAVFVRQNLNVMGNKYQTYYYHFILAAHGYFPSFEYLVENSHFQMTNIIPANLPASNQPHDITPLLPKAYLESHKKWWDENKGNIVYDKATFSYILKSDKKK